jgi:hypothetical protein
LVRFRCDQGFVFDTAEVLRLSGLWCEEVAQGSTIPWIGKNVKDSLPLPNGV